jgi:hypothetical protein
MAILAKLPSAFRNDISPNDGWALYRQRVAGSTLSMLAMFGSFTAVATELRYEDVATTHALGDASFFDSFGRTVAIEGDIAAVGVPFDDVGPADAAGSVYVFHRNQGIWQLQQKLVAPQLTGFARFGTSIDIDGGHLVVGAPGDRFPSGLRSGAIHVFELAQGTWQPVARLTGSVVNTGDNLGVSVAIDGDRIAAGAPTADGGLPDQGAVEVFQRTSGQWTHAQRLLPDQPGTTNFGRAVGLQGDRLLVTEITNDIPAVKSFVHNLGTWAQHQALSATVPGMTFNINTVAIDGTHAIVGAAGGSGGAYAFELVNGSWVEQGLLQPAAGSVGDGFGRSIALSGARLLIGAPLAGTGSGTDKPGKVYPYSWSGTQWIAGTPLQRANARHGDQYGASLALSADNALIGAPLAEAELPIGINSGLVEVLDWTSGTPTVSATLDAGLALDRVGRYLGASVSVGDDIAVVGAPWETSLLGDFGAGSAYILRREKGLWRAVQRISAGSEQTPSEYFGSSVALSTDSVFIGEPHNDDGATVDAGAVHLFTETNGQYTLATTLRASDASSYATFGYAVARSGNTLVVGAPMAQVGQMYQAGKAYVFELQNGSWSQVAAFSGNVASGVFGVAVAMQGDLIAIGASGYDLSFAGAKVHLFERSNGTWTAADVLTPPTVGGANDRFGWALAISDGRLAIGAPDASNGLGQGGRVDVFARANGTWGHQASLFAGDQAASREFGSCVAMSGDHVVVGDPGRDADGGGEVYGALHLFRLEASLATEVDVVLGKDLIAGTRELGSSCAIDGTRLLAGAPSSDGSVPWGNPMEGSAYFFEVPPVLFANGFE